MDSFMFDLGDPLGWDESFRDDLDA